MTIEGRDDGRGRRIRLGMVGGGQGAFIGAVHRMAARIDDRFELVAGALSSSPEKAAASAAEIGLEPGRSYGSFEEMAKTEKQRPDGIEAVAIVTPNHMHFPVAKVFLEAGYHVICDKPVTKDLAEAKELAAIVKRSGKAFVLTHNYTGYPMIRQARAMCAAGDLGAIRLVHAQYIQDFLATGVEKEGQKQAAWRVDPEKSGAGGTIGDIGTHAFNLASFVTGLELESLACELTSFGEGRALDDNAQMLLRYKEKNGVSAKGSLWASQVVIGPENGLSLTITGTEGGLYWHQEEPNQLWFTRLGQPKQLLTRGGAGSNDAAGRVTRIPAGHPEGYLEGFATIYAEAADLIAASDAGEQPLDGLATVTIEDGVIGMAFIEACVASSKANGAWTTL